MAKDTTSKRAGSRKKREPMFSRFRKFTGAKEAQKRRRGGISVNPYMPRPTPYCSQVTGNFCSVCGEYADMVTFGIDEQDAAIRLRSSYPEGKAPEGQLYISRGPLLWTMHILKQEEFLLRHLPHCELAAEYESSGVSRVPIPPPVIWAESFGDPKSKRVAEAFMKDYNKIESGLIPGDVVEPKDYTPKMNKNLDILINLRPKKDREILKADLKDWKQTFFETQETNIEDFPF
jgi:hypothetical protein